MIKTHTNKPDLNILNPGNQDKICIVVYGNIAAGKTTFSQALLKLLPGYNYVCLDDYRLKLFRDQPTLNGIGRERKAEADCLEAILSSRLLVYETTGASLFYKRMKPRLRGHFKTLYVYIECSASDCEWRFVERKRKGYKTIAPPFNGTLRSIMNDIRSKHYDLDPDVILSSEILSEKNMLDTFLKYIKPVR